MFRRIGVTGAAALAVLFLALPAFAKEQGLAGVMVYPGPDGMAYVQFNGLLINGKLEFKSCGAPTLNKNLYGKLQKEKTEGLKSLERLADGSLQADMGAGVTCVVPANFKYDKDATMTQGEVIEKSAWTAQIVGGQPSGLTALPTVVPGTKIYFVSPSDNELAEYLRADRAATIPLWKAYVTTYASSPHSADARKSLEKLLIQDGRVELGNFDRSKNSAAPAYAHLKAASARVYEVFALDASQADATALQTDVDADLTAICTAGSTQLAAYKKALADQTKGYKSLVTAKTLSDAAFDADPKFAPAVSLHKDVSLEVATYDGALKAAESKDSAQHYDEAYLGVTKYLSFVGEEDRVTAVVQAAYKFHMDRGAQAAAAAKWADAVAEYKKAIDDQPTDTAKAKLAEAEAGFVTTKNKEAAESAKVKSAAFVSAQDNIKAYEVFADLTPDQQKLVSDEMEAVKPAYIASATDLSKKLQQTHTPIKGRADEDAVRQAYDYLTRVDKLTDDPDVEVRRDLLSDAISAYYVDLAKKYVEKPVASGVGLGWSYLGEASQYKPGLDTIRDEMSKASATYQMRSKLSVGVEFRDQTSRRDSVGFAEQLQDAIATGLETSRLPVKVIRPTASGFANTGSGLDPNFKLVGEILQHRTIKTVANETLQSKYRFGEHEIPNAAWSKADVSYQDAMVAVQKGQDDLRLAQAKNNKKMMDAANDAIAAAQKKASDARAVENMTPKTLQEDVIRPYSYTKQTIDITNIVEMSFRIVDSTGAMVDESKHVIREVPKKFTVLENIKPDDTEGIKAMDAVPDETQLMTDVEIAARDELVKLAHDAVVALPAKILASARAKVAASDADAAAELYILYLNSTTATETPERAEAIHFLTTTYNIRHASALSASSQ